MKLMNLGLPKSGTTTLQKALEETDKYKPVHWKLPEGPYVGEIMYRDYFAHGDACASLVGYGYNAITQADVCWEDGGVFRNYWPNLDYNVIENVASQHQECKFLLLTRDPNKIITSIQRWNTMPERLRDHDIPGLPLGYGFPVHLHRWILLHYTTCLTYGSLLGDRFLAVDVEDTFIKSKLESFLDVSLPEWGVHNQSLLEDRS